MGDIGFQQYEMCTFQKTVWGEEIKSDGWSKLLYLKPNNHRI